MLKIESYGAGRVCVFSARDEQICPGAGICVVCILYISVETDQFLYAAFRVFQVAIPLFIQQRAIGFFCIHFSSLDHFSPYSFFSPFLFALQNYEAQFDKWADRVSSSSLSCCCSGNWADCESSSQLGESYTTEIACI